MPQSHLPATPTPVSVPTTVTTPPMMWIYSLPSSVLSWCLSPFLNDTDAAAVATCSKESLDAMQRAPYYIKNQLWVMTAEVFADLYFCTEASGTGVWLTPPPQFRFGQLRRAMVRHAHDHTHMTSLIAALPKSVNELEVKFSRIMPAMGLFNPIVYPVQLTSLLLSTIRLPANGAPLDLPPNLHTLALPYCPDHPRWQDVFTVLPESLLTLHLGDFAEQRSLEDFIFPPYLTELNMGLWRGPITELPPLPTGLRTLAVPWFQNGVCDLVKRLPSSVTELLFHTGVADSLDDVEWPPSLRMMRLSYRQPLLNWRPPPVLETLHLHWYLPPSDLCLPATLQRLILWNFDGFIPASFGWPVALEELELSAWNCSSHQLRLPPRLRKLRFGSEFNQSVAELELPSTLEWLGFGDSFNQPVEGVLRLPMRLQQLHFGLGYNKDKFNQPLTNMQWPSSLQSLFLPSSLELSLEGLPHQLPASLRALHRYVESTDATIESAWTAIAASLPRCEMILHRPRLTNPSPQQISFELFK